MSLPPSHPFYLVRVVDDAALRCCYETHIHHPFCIPTVFSTISFAGAICGRDVPIFSISSSYESLKNHNDLPVEFRDFLYLSIS